MSEIENESSTPNLLPDTSNLHDPGWKHCTAISADKKYVKCNYCEKSMWGGINRMKHHLARISGDSISYPKIPNDESQIIKKYLEECSSKKSKKRSFKKQCGIFGEGIMVIEVDEDETNNQLRRKEKGKSLEDSSQPLMKTFLDKDSRKKVCSLIARWFYHAAIPFNAADSIYFQRAVEAIRAYGPTLKAPTPHELGGPLLMGEVEVLNLYLKELRDSWMDSGCSIMSDGWTNQKGRTLINFLVSCPRGVMFLKSVDASNIVKNTNNLFNLLDQVVEEVGEENVVQVITDNASNYVAAGKLLMEKRKNLFWTPCMAHCIDLILEKIGKMKSIKRHVDMSKEATKFTYNHSWVLSLMRSHTGRKEIIRPTVTRFATNFILIESLLAQRDSLRNMFNAKEWRESKYSKLQEGMKAEDILTDQNFWRKLEEIKNVFEPLVRVLRIVDNDKHPAMGFILDAMVQAKTAIAESFGGDLTRYKKYWDIIDEKWTTQLHSPLHLAGYYLNPQFHYSHSKERITIEVQSNLRTVIQTLLTKEDNQVDAIMGVMDYDDALGPFGLDLAIFSRKVMPAVKWWHSHMCQARKDIILQKLAIRILSRNCFSSGCERNWSTFDQIYTKKRNRLLQEKLDRLVFVHYNLRLRERQLKRHNYEYDLINFKNFLLEDNDELVDANVEDTESGQAAPSSLSMSAFDDEDDEDN